MNLLLTLALFLPTLAMASMCQEHFNARGELRRIDCPVRTTELRSNRLGTREVLWQLPESAAPARGFPVVILSQGSWFPVEFSRVAGLPMGGFNEIKLIQKLLDHGYAVIAPRATLNVGWTTNLPLPDYKKTSDYELLSNVLAHIDSGKFGALNRRRLYAAGISSGGYNTSRLALTFPGRFKAIAIESASYASCFGPLCSVPAELPATHPPTLFLHGGSDRIVPISTAELFYRRLQEHGIDTEFVTDPDFGHGWLDAAPESILDWFNRYF